MSARRGKSGIVARFKFSSRCHEKISRHRAKWHLGLVLACLRHCSQQTRGAEYLLAAFHNQTMRSFQLIQFPVRDEYSVSVPSSRPILLQMVRSRKNHKYRYYASLYPSAADFKQASAQVFRDVQTRRDDVNFEPFQKLDADLSGFT